MHYNDFKMSYNKKKQVFPLNFMNFKNIFFTEHFRMTATVNILYCFEKTNQILLKNKYFKRNTDWRSSNMPAYSIAIEFNGALLTYFCYWIITNCSNSCNGNTFFFIDKTFCIIHCMPPCWLKNLFLMICITTNNLY